VTAAPQLEQNRALWGNPVPQRLQKNAMIDPSFSDPIHFQHTEKSSGRFHSAPILSEGIDIRFVLQRLNFNTR
jgi:hypothetical protein